MAVVAFSSSFFVFVKPEKYYRETNQKVNEVIVVF